MEIVKLFAPVRPFRFEYGDIVNGITKIEWTERYREADDFKLTAPLESRVDQILPIGSCITHTESSTIMLVENIEINEATENEDSMIMISGRSLETMFENRVRGALYFNQSPYPPEGHPYGLVWDFWDPFQQWRTGGATDLEHMWGHYFDNRQLGGDDSDTKWKSADFVYWLLYPFLSYGGATFNPPADPNDRYYPSGITYPLKVTGDFQALFNGLPSSKMEPRQINSGEGPIYDKMLEVLESDNLGIRVMNPRYTKEKFTGESDVQALPVTYFYIHAGKVRKDVTFSSYHGDIESAQYLWSNKNYYNDVYIRGTHMAYRLKKSGYTGFGRRTLYADYTEADGHLQDDGIGWYMSLPEDFGEENGWGASTNYANPATGPFGNHSAYAWYLRVFAAMRAKAQELLGQHKITATAAVEVKKNLTRYIYRRDFDIGDLVTIDTELVPNSVRRIVEYVEIQDENGYIGYPVLEAPNSVIHGYTAQT